MEAFEPGERSDVNASLRAGNNELSALSRLARFLLSAVIAMFQEWLPNRSRD